MRSSRSPANTARSRGRKPRTSSRGAAEIARYDARRTWLGSGFGLGLGLGLGPGLGLGLGVGFGFGLGLGLGSPAWLVEMTRKEWRLETTSASAMLIRAGWR